MKIRIYQCIGLWLFTIMGQLVSSAQVNPELEGGRLSHMDTIERAYEDLKSDSVDTRVGAIILLSKYNDPDAVSGVISGLVDGHVRVRRAALVSMVEKQGVISPQAIEPVLRMIDDEDAEIRRMVSSSLGMFLNLWNNYFSGNAFGGSRKNLPMDIQQKMVSVFLDEDVVVRRNMVSYFFQLNIQMPDYVLERLLTDVDDRVRLESLRLAYRISNIDTVVKMSDTLKVDSYQAIRIMFAHILGSFSGNASREILEEMLEDKDPEVAVEAELALFRQEPTLAEARRLLNYLVSNRFNQEQGESYIETIAYLRTGSLELLQQVLASDNTEYRLAALRRFTQEALLGGNEELLLKLANDSSNRIRSQVINLFRMRREEVSFDLVDGLVLAKYSDVRESSVMLTRSLEKEDAELLLLDFLIDEEAAIRVLALNELKVSEYEDLSKILRLSLKDADFQVQRQAVLLLINLNDPRELEYLITVYNEEPRSRLGSAIKSLMSRKAGVNL